MVVPALIYLARARGGPAPAAGAMPMATDIAFALGVLTLGRGARAAVAEVAAAHARDRRRHRGDRRDRGLLLGWRGLVVAAGGAVADRPRAREPARSRSVRPVSTCCSGAALWFATYRAGVHPTIAGVVLGLLTPAHPFQRPAAVSDEAHRVADETMDDPEPPDADATAWLRLAWLVPRGRLAARPGGARAPAVVQLRDPAAVRARERRRDAHRWRGGQRPNERRGPRDRSGPRARQADRRRPRLRGRCQNGRGSVGAWCRLEVIWRGSG